tara:strand:- start:5272 stop:6489 length:1218 start_codon:yes stop_codon:yes gene_type:complete
VDLKQYKKIIYLGMHPHADTFISKEQLCLSEDVYPLECYLNEDSGDIRLGITTSANERYNLYDYSYTSSNSAFAKEHWDELSETVFNRFELNSSSYVVEVGSNDGYLIGKLAEKGVNTLGVDASQYMTKIAAKNNNIKTCCAIFGEKVSEDLLDKYGQADLIIANNVFNHANNPVDFAKGVKNLLKTNGVFVYEVPYWLNTIKDKKFDQIYHEHISYFTVKSSLELLKSVGLEIFDVQVVNYHGGSIRVFSRLKEQNKPVNAVIDKMIKDEKQLGLFDADTYISFMGKIKKQRNKFLQNLYSIKSQGHSIIAVGAAAKGNTFLNFYNLDSTVIDYVTDASIHKQGKYTPLTRIPIVGDEIFSKYDKVYALILSWNISDKLKSKLRKINKNIEFLDLSGENEDKKY